MFQGLLKGSAPEIQDENLQELMDAGHDEQSANKIAYKTSMKGLKPLKVAKPIKLKRPTLHPLHPFNLPHAPK